MSTDTPARSRWQTAPTLAVLGVGLLVVATVWLLSCIWSFGEQTRAARALGFEHPHVLPWMLDALAAALALVALAAALAGQSAGLARLGVLLALAGSVWANAAGVVIRSHGNPNHDAVAMAAVAPLSAFIALEVILGKGRRLVLWLRGEEPPAAIPHLRLIRLALSPRTFADWRRAVLDLTQTPAAGVVPAAPAAGLDAPVIPAGGTGPGAVPPASASPGPAQIVPAVDKCGADDGRSGVLSAPPGDAGGLGVVGVGPRLPGPDAAPAGAPECAPAPDSGVHLTPVPSAPASAPGRPRPSAVGSAPGSRTRARTRTSAASAPTGAPGRTRVTAPAGAPDRSDEQLASALRALRVAEPRRALDSGRTVGSALGIGQDRARRILALIDQPAGDAS